MCAACGRPQFAGEGKACTACGAVLPEAPMAAGAGGRERLIQQYQPFLEATVGPGRRLLLSAKALEWHDGKRPAYSIPLSKLAAVELSRRPVFEALVFTALAAAGAALVPWPPGRVALGLLGVLALVACFAQRRLAFVLHGRDGGRRELFWVVGTPNAAVVRTVQSVWASVRDELVRAGVAAREGA